MSNTLSPMVNDTLGMEDRELHATADSPFGLGSRSQSCMCNRGHEPCSKTYSIET